MSTEPSAALPVDFFVPTPRMLNARIEQLGHPVFSVSQEKNGLTVITDYMRIPLLTDPIDDHMKCVDALASRITKPELADFAFCVFDVHVEYHKHCEMWCYIAKAHIRYIQRQSML